MIIDQHTDLYGVVGYPIGHTLSPAIQNAAFSASGMNAVYLAFESMDIKGCLEGVRALRIKGLSVTIPHKSEVIPLLDQLDDLAKKIGAVNTIVNHDGYLIGYNTDAMAALQALNEKTTLFGKSCLIVGAGGAARAVGFTLKEQGVHLIITNRSKTRGKDLATSLGCPFVPLEKIERIQTDLLIQTTPLGMFPSTEQCTILPEMLREGMVVMDVVYNPPETKLLKMARERGCLTVNGLTMFVYQGAEQFRLWTGCEAPMTAIRVALKEALGGAT